MVLPGHQKQNLCQPVNSLKLVDLINVVNLMYINNEH